MSDTSSTRSSGEAQGVSRDPLMDASSITGSCGASAASLQCALGDGELPASVVLLALRERRSMLANDATCIVCDRLRIANDLASVVLLMERLAQTHDDDV